MATKKIVEKKTGEKYSSKAAKAKHEKTESKAEMKKEYGKPKGPMQTKSPIKQVAKAKSLMGKAVEAVKAKKAAAASATSTKTAVPPTKMKKC